MGGLPSRAYTTRQGIPVISIYTWLSRFKWIFAYFGPFISLTWPLWILYLGRSLDDQLRFTLSRCHYTTCFRPIPEVSVFPPPAMSMSGFSP